MFLLPICFLFLFPLSVWRLIHPVYLSDRGVECCRFDKVIRLIPWEQIDEVRIEWEFPFSMKTSGQRCIRIIPKSFEDTSPIQIDNSDHIRQFIEARHGEILDCSHM